MSKTVTIYTQVYNTKPFLSRCVESVLQQTYSDFEYILIDNGSTDGCKEILEQYASADSRIKLIRLPTNQSGPRWLKMAKEECCSEYTTNLDSDDWLEKTFLEKMVALAEDENLDIVCTGTAFHAEGQNNVATGIRARPQRVIIEKSQYSAYLPYYHEFFRTVWGKLVRKNVFQKADYSLVEKEKLSNGADTVVSFAWLRAAKRICIDNSVLHHYLIRKKSVYHTYQSKRFRSNVILHQDAIRFLSQFGSISQKNLNFLHIVYANAVSDTLEVLWNSDLSSDEKLDEYCVIALHPTTCEAYRDIDEAIDRSRNTLRQQILSTAAQCSGKHEDFSVAMRKLFPQCGQAVSMDAVPLFARESDLMGALLRDDAEGLVKSLLYLIREKRYTKQYSLGEIIRDLASEKLLLCNLSDVRFLRKYGDIYWKIWHGNTMEALDDMTGMLLEDKVVGSEDTFLQLYLSAAAYLEQAPAFLFGKKCLAQLYRQRNQMEQYRVIARELEEMGVDEPW